MSEITYELSEEKNLVESKEKNLNIKGPITIDQKGEDDNTVSIRISTTQGIMLTGLIGTRHIYNDTSSRIIVNWIYSSYSSGGWNESGHDVIVDSEIVSANGGSISINTGNDFSVPLLLFWYKMY